MIFYLSRLFNTVGNDGSSGCHAQSPCEAFIDVSPLHEILLHKDCETSSCGTTPPS